MERVMTMAVWRSLMLGACLVCAGCGSVPLTSVPQLSRIDPGTTDPAALRLALRLPVALRPQPGGVALQVTLRIEGEPEAVEDFALVAVQDEADLAGLPATSSGFASHAFRLEPAGSARLEQLRHRVATARAARRKGSLTIGVRATAFCRASSAPIDDVRMTAYLKSAETSSYVVLVKDVELTGLKEAVAAIDPC